MNSQKLVSNRKKLKLVILDANFYWAEQLFSAYSDYADILLLRPVDFRTFKKRYGSYFVDLKPRQINEGVWEQKICCPPGWLFHYWFLTESFLTYTIQKFQGNNPLIFVFSYPYYHTLARKLKSYSIYYNIDDYRYYWMGRETQTLEIEKLAINCANLTLCTANYRALYLKKVYPLEANQITHIPHGCSPKFMVEQPLSKPKSLPVELRSYSRPLVGYIGALNYRFDFHYLAKVAKQISDVTIVLGGSPPQPSDGSPEWFQGVEALRSLSNIHFLGRVTHERVGEYLQSFDVLLMPYSQCNFNLNACPMKLWDYMGTSLPIVANDVVPEVNLWNDIILVSKNPKEFAKNIRFALANPDWKSQQRWEVAQDHTWKKQAQKLHYQLEERKWLSQQSV
ncbi:glycosyltransferase [Mastigocoleus testarum]|uniref:Glycosyltransferase n=1 Tax=Mastigocoleus testarum BC008 TaxID=371196 RepID=A0A0V7ZFM2_9CYAN|nr:glycosyltransferase [Mastigocoleus testarum]KST63321.1 hypothetical protein BC008_39245 [Mastigocoleus testarum BC008]